PIYGITSHFHIETIDFIMNPGLWLNMMSQYRINITGCPNFGLALVLRYLSRKKPEKPLDLSSMKAMLNGAEPISVRIMNDFIDALEPYSFNPDAMMPVYGMAEATLALTFTPLMQPSTITSFSSTKLDRENMAIRVESSDPETRVISGVGSPLNDVEIRVVNESDEPLPDNISGHLQVRGAGITKGYYNKAEATLTAFCGDWLRTGDIGFFFDGNLYISGRHKDIIFKNGRNYFANDLEAMACTIEHIDYGKVCFGGTTNLETGHDKVIVFIAGIPDSRALDTFRELRGLLRSNLGITLDEMIPIKSNEVPKTSSGKLQRFKLMQRYLNGEFDSKRITAES
ncbi:MAG: AMP-binding protein, partial [Bacteroidota bacterium]